ncbi:MAG: LPD23 domain-containing protein [Prevotella sp.]|nr:LPD23 domain-containing protein [Prevotella sp.]
MPEIQKAIEAWYGCAASNDAFAKAGNYKSARAAMRDWTLQTNMLDDSMPSDKFSNFAMELACRLQGCTMREVQQNLNDFFDLVQGKSQGDLFGGTTMGEQADRQEAIRRVFNIEYKPIKNKENGKKGSNAVADDNSQGGEGRHGSPGDGAGRERAAGAGQHADVAGGAEEDDEGPKPVGHGRFSDIYTNYKGSFKDAVHLLKEKGSGYIRGMFHRDEIGDIDIAWGSAPTPYTGKGIAHILRKHVETLGDFKNENEAISVIEDTILHGDVKKQEGNTWAITKGDFQIVVTRDEDGNWVLTAFDRNHSAKSKKEKKDAAAIGTPSQPNVEAGAVASNLSAAKLGNSSESSDKKSEKVGEGADNSVKKAAAEQHRSTERSNDSGHSIGATDTPGKVAAERQNVNTEPTEGQKEAGNYKKGHIKVDGYDITIENPKGSTRSGKDASGKAWSVPMHYDYGYIKGTEGVDGDHIDVYLSDDPTQGNVYVIDQVNQKDGSFDEHKVMYGFPSMKAAVDAYKGQYEDGWKVGTVTEVSREDFKKWVESSKRKTKPFAEYRSIQYTEPSGRQKAAAQQQRPTDSIGARPAQGAATTTDDDRLRTHERTSLQSGEKGDVKQMKAGGGVASVSKCEAVLRDAVMDLEREAGLDVIDDVEEGQRVLDMANGRVQLQASWNGLKKASNFILSSLSGKAHQRSTKIEIPERANRLAEKAIGHPIVSHSIRANELQHIEKRHGVNGTANDKNSIPLRKEDIALMPYIMAAPTRVVKGTRAVNGTESVRYEKDLSNGTVLIVEREGRFDVEDMENITMWAQKKPATNVTVAQGASHSTSETIVISETDAAKIRKDAEEAVKKDEKFREQRVYHGSAADFDAFDHSHMGEGEGAQAHGWGTYVTKNKGVGMTYAAKSSKATGLKRSELESNIHRAEDQLPYLHGDVKAEKEKELKAWKDELAKLDDTKLVYTVEIPDDTGDNYLEEAQTLQDLNRPDMAGRIDKVMDDYFGAKDFWNSWQTPGLAMREEFIRLSMGQHLEKSRSDAERKYSELLSEAGVVGLHYNGRKDGDCYVIFNDKDLKIKDKVRFFRTSDGDAYGYTVGGKIYIDPRIATSETPIHEYAHLWAEALRKANPKEWQNVVELMKECKSVWEQVKKEYPELKTDDEIADEVLAHYSGRRGAERLRQEAAKAAEEAKGVLDKASVVSAFGRLREAIKKAWKHIAEDVLHIHFTSAEEVADKVMYDLLNKVKPGNIVEHGFDEAETGRAEQLKVETDRKEEKESAAFNKELQKIIDQKADAKSILPVGRVGSALRQCGFPDVPIEMPAKVVTEKNQPNYAINHPFAAEELKDLPKAINHPVMVFKSLTEPNSQVVLTELHHDGKNFVVAVKLNYAPHGIHSSLRVNSIRSVYPKEAQSIVDWLNRSDLLIKADKNKAMEWLTQQQSNSADVENHINNLDVAANIVRNLGREKLFDENVSEKQRIRYQFIGEHGAKALDLAEERNVRMDNLRVAREMKAAGKDAKKIKLATGWEHGADGKWRYETSDAQYTQPSHPKNGESYKLSDLLGGKGARELFAAYPDMRNTAVVFKDKLGDHLGSYDRSDGRIYLSTEFSGSRASHAILHEIQHAIQVREGFEPGTNLDKASGLASKFIDAYHKGLSEIENRLWTLEHEKGIDVNRNQFYDYESSPKFVDPDVQRLRYELEALRRQNLIKPIDAYRRTAGEVEARNVERRNGMTDEERRQSLGAETEDVAREMQIFLRVEHDAEQVKEMTPRTLYVFGKWLKIKRAYDEAREKDALSDRTEELRRMLEGWTGLVSTARDVLKGLGSDMRELLKANGFKDEDLKEYEEKFGGEGVNTGGESASAVSGPETAPLLRAGDEAQRTHERTSLQTGAETGARPAQGAATTTDEGLVRTHERTSLPNEMRRVSSSNDKELSVTRLPSDTNLPLKTYEGKDCEVSVGEALTAINNLRGDYVTLDGHSLTSSKDTRRKLGNVLRTGKDNDDLRVALSHVPEILSSSVLVEEHRDRTKVDGVRKSENPSDPNIEKVQVYYGPVKINGKLYRVKTTVPVFMTGNNRIRGYEIGNMELSSPTPTVDSQGVGRLRTSSISLANLLKNVEFSYEKGKKILDEIDKSDSDAPTTPAEAEESDVLYRESTEDNDASKGRFIFEGEPVSELSGTEFGDLSKDLKEEVARYFTDEWGGSVERPGFGDVILDKRSVKDDVSHGMNRQKAASFMAVPYIIRDGVVIDEQENWKGRNYDSVTIAAPITIGKERCIGIAIVKRQPGSNRFYLHTVMLQKSLQVGMLRTGTEAASRQGDIAKILNNLYHAVKKDENLSREGDGAYSDDELSELNDPFVKMLGEKARSAKQRKAFAARERRNMADAVRELAERLHLDNVEIVTEPMEVKDRRGKVHHPKGFFNTKTGKITVVIPNHANVDDAVQTLLHEAVAHYGLRELFGEHFDTFLRNVYEAADMDVRRRITELALRKYGGDFRVATEEYLASLAEDTDFENIPHGFWQKIKRMFLAMLHAIGFDGFADKGVTLSDNELLYILWRSYENLKEPGEHRSILGEAEDVAKQVELKVGNYGDTAAEEEPADVAEELDARAEEIRNMPAIPIKKHDTSREYVREK